MSKEKIAIIGSGIAGIALALLLELEFKDIYQVSIFERDDSFNSRSQGYSLTIQRNGFKVLNRLGVEKEIRKATELRCKRNITYKVLNNNLNNSGDNDNPYLKNVEIISQHAKTNISKMNVPLPRQMIRKILLERYEKVSGQSVNYNKKVIDLVEEEEELENNVKRPKITLTFEDQSTFECNLVIGCDGLFSTIRKLLKLKGDDNYSNNLLNSTVGHLEYLDVAIINGISTIEDDDLFNSVYKDNVIQVIDGKNRLFLKPFFNNRIMWQLTFPLDRNSEEIKVYKNEIMLEKEKILNYAICQIKEWKETPFLDLLEKQTKVEDIRGGLLHQSRQLKEDELPFNTNLKNVTLVGDAIHAMAPFKGQGFNNALQDVEELVDLLTTKKKTNLGMFDYKNLFEIFEKNMIKRAYRVENKSKDLVMFLHTSGAAEKTTFLEKRKNKNRNE
ncbi:hypothetical protein ABK040_008865 [Willaertia magna]